MTPRIRRRTSDRTVPEPVRPWHQREPFAVWAPLAAVVVTVTQSLSYSLHRYFYEGLFGVAPEEVGSDYTSLLARNAVPLAVLGLGSFALLAFFSLQFGFAARFVISGREREKRIRHLRAHKRVRFAITLCSIALLWGLARVLAANFPNASPYWYTFCYSSA